MDPEARETLTSDPDIGPVVEEYGPITVTPAEDLFSRFVVSILRQQVSMAAATAIRERLFERFEVTPTTMLAADNQALQEIGLSAAKAEYVTAAAERFAQRGYDHAYFAGEDDGAVIEELTSIHGVGPWTAKMFLLFCLGRSDVFPVEDLGIRSGMHEVVDPELTRADMRARAAQWAPYRSYASLYLWQVTE
jgi:DNA-3-methyladenine glycosylase II